MPKLLQINSTANWGSTGKIAEQIGALAISHGWDSYIAYGRYANPSRSKTIKVGSKISQFLHLITSRIFDNHGLASRIATKALVKQIKKLSPDIIHLHNIHGYYLNYKILFEYLNTTQIPVVWTLHDCWPFTGHCAHFVEADCTKWLTQCEKCPLIGQYPKAFTDNSKQNFQLKKKLFSRIPDRLIIVSVSQWLKSYVNASFLKACKTMTIYNGVDIDVFCPSLKTSTDKIVLGVSSIWSESKGLNDFIILRDILPSDIQIILVGLSSKQIMSLPKGIIGIERTNNLSELAQLYSSADVFVNPTYADTFPTVNLEALACGTPVITYNTGGSPEAITPETGIVVEQGNTEKLKTAIISILSKGKKEYSSACRERAEMYFGKGWCFEKYISLYYELLA